MLYDIAWCAIGRGRTHAAASCRGPTTQRMIDFIVCFDLGCVDMARKLVARAGAHREGRYAHRRFFWRGAATVPWALGLMMDSSPLIGYFCAIFL